MVIESNFNWKIGSNIVIQILAMKLIKTAAKMLKLTILHPLNSETYKKDENFVDLIKKLQNMQVKKIN